MFRPDTVLGERRWHARWANKYGAARRRDLADHKRSVFVPVPCIEAVVAILLLPVRRDVMLAMSRTFIFALDPGVGVALCVEFVITRHDHIACTCGHLLVDRSGWRNIDVESDACRLHSERGREGSRDRKSQKRFPDVHGESLFDWRITSLCRGSAGARQRLSSSRVVRCRETGAWDCDLRAVCRRTPHETSRACVIGASPWFYW